MKVLITGGAGFIGTHIVDKIINNSHRAVIIDNLATGKKENIHPEARFYNLDITDKLLHDIFKKEKPDIVIHQAAQVDLQTSNTNPMLDAKINILGFLNVLKYCVNFNVKKIIGASSAAVYGNPDYLKIDENHPLNPRSGYGISKSTMSKYLSLYNRLYDLKYTVLRYSNVYGPNQNHYSKGGIVSILITKLLNNESPVIFSDGSQTRDFIYVKDVARANIKALHLADNEILNISTGNQTSVNELFNIIKNITGSNLNPVYRKPRKGEIIHSCLSNKKAREILNWQPIWPLKKGLTKTVKNYNKNV